MASFISSLASNSIQHLLCWSFKDLVQTHVEKNSFKVFPSFILFFKQKFQDLH